MMKVRDVMTAPVVTVAPDTPLKVAAALMLHHRISGLPVVDD
jgi:CBS domain-containing protein